MILASLALLASAGEPGYRITRQTIDGGGRMNSSGGDYELSGTIGQPDAGQMTGDGYALTGGFWFEVGPGDCDENGLTNLLDHEVLAACMTGPDVTPADPTCRCFDMDRNGSVDMADVAAIQRAFTGP